MAPVSECSGSSIKIDKKRHLVLLQRIWVQVSSHRASSLMECITRFFYSFSLCVVFVCLILGLDLEPHTREAIFVGDGVPQTWVILLAVVFTEGGPRSWKRNKSIETTEMRMWKLKWLLVLFVRLFVSAQLSFSVFMEQYPDCAALAVSPTPVWRLFSGCVLGEGLSAH